MNGDTPKSIVHPTDLSFASQDAFAHALRIAVACKSMLHILHIEAPETEEEDWDRFPQMREMLARWKMISPTATRAEAAEQLGVKIVKASVESESLPGCDDASSATGAGTAAGAWTAVGACAAGTVDDGAVS